MVALIDCDAGVREQPESWINAQSSCWNVQVLRPGDYQLVSGCFNPGQFVRARPGCMKPAFLNLPPYDFKIGILFQSQINRFRKRHLSRGLRLQVKGNEAEERRGNYCTGLQRLLRFLRLLRLARPITSSFDDHEQNRNHEQHEEHREDQARGQYAPQRTPQTRAG